MRERALLLAAGLPLVALASAAIARPGPDPKPAPPVRCEDPSPRPRVQIALLLDTSNSMDGLIGQARAQLWNIVCDLAKSKRQGVPPRLEVALYEYGNSGLNADTGWVRQVLPLTDDLDAISEKLFMLTTNGGEEYCGKVIQAATQQLEWSHDVRDLRMIVIAGNEPFTQGPADFRTSVPAAASAGIIVNTIHCGGDREGIEGSWKLGATLGGGCYSFIDSNLQPRHCPSPYDDRISKLGAELNGTYVPYGGEGKRYADRQEKQDKLAASEPGAAPQRAAAKSTGLYNNSRWDLVDAVRDGKKKVEELKDDEVPEAMRKMNAPARTAYLQEQTNRRAQLQKEIAELEEQRQQFIAEQMKNDANRPQTWGEALQKAIREQAAQKGLNRE